MLIVTALSLIVALAMSFTAWRLGREERRRTAARVAALSAAAGISPAELGITSPAVDHIGPRAVDLPKAPWAPSPLATIEIRPSASTPARADADQFDDRLNPRVFESWPILASADEPQPSGGRQRGLAAAVAVLLVALLGGMVWMMAGREPGVASAASPTAPLELVSLRHERQWSKLAVSGLVRNPATGHPVDHLAAVVFLFDQQGAFVTSAKAAVDFVRLGSGDESPFVVTLDAPATIARYRVSFRTDQGIVPHADRRGASPIAAQAEQAASVPMK
ncbi:MAG: hypothetical protein ACRD2N_01955 [Vicinamibacterales bacterium]